MKQFVGAIDQGTTSTRFMLFNHSGSVVASHQLEHAQIFPQAGWVEHDPLEIWARTQDVIQTTLKKAAISPAQLAAIGITNQRETTVVWNRHTGKPYANAIVWQDTRTASICQELATIKGQNRFRQQTGLPLATYFSGPKLIWLLENVPELRQDALNGDALFGNIDSWLIWNLTGEHITDVTNASRTMLMNLELLDWDEQILTEMNIPRQMLPTIRPSSAIYGYTKTDGPFAASIPVAGDLGDQQAALVGQTCFTPGEAKNTYGTGCFMLMNTGSEIVHSKHGLLTTVAYQLEGKPAVYALEGSVAIAGALVQWLRDNLSLIEHSSEIEQLARTVSDNGGVYFVPAFSGLYAPYWRDDARGVIVGLTRYVNKGHIARASLEATCYQTREILDAMNQDAAVPLTQLKVDGGMTINEDLMQWQADILGVDVIRPVVNETTSLGAAYAAGLAVGYWSSLEETRQNWSVSARWHAQISAETRATGFKQWQKAVTRTFDWVD